MGARDESTYLIRNDDKWTNNEENSLTEYSCKQNVVENIQPTWTAVKKIGTEGHIIY